MINESLLNYIRQGRAAGLAKEAIVNSLTANGWVLADVNEGFSKLDGFVTSAPPVVSATLPSVQLSPATAATTPVQPVAAKQSSKKTWPIYMLAGGVVLILCAGGAFWYWFRTQPTNSAPVVTPPASSVPAPVATDTAPALSTFSFTPKASGLIAFSFEYPAALGSSTVKENAYGASVVLGSSTMDAMTLTFSFFPNPLQPSQTVSDYLKATFLTGTTTTSMVAGREIVSVHSLTFPAGQALYYLFLKDQSVMTVEITGTSTGRDAVVQSVQFADPMY